MSIPVDDQRPIGPEAAALRDALSLIVADGKVAPGYFQVQLRPGAPWSPVYIWHGQAPDPETPPRPDDAPWAPVWFGDLEPRGGFMWRCLINGRERRLEFAWPRCARHPISQADYRYMLDYHHWARRHAPERPEAAPHRAVDYRRLRHDLGPQR